MDRVFLIDEAAGGAEETGNVETRLVPKTALLPQPHLVKQLLQAKQ